MKRLLAIALAAALLLALAGCGKKIPVVAPTREPVTTEDAVITRSPAKDETVVSTLQEFIRAVGSDRKLYIDAEILLSREIDWEEYWEEDFDETKELYFPDYHNPYGGYLTWEEVFDGYELIIKEVKNLTIRCGPSGSLVTGPRYSFVLNFQGCEGITLEGLTAGHTEGGTCTGGVLRFADCKDIQINDCNLYGCGTEGLLLENVDGLSMEGGSIYECTYDIMSVVGGTNLAFRGCTFRDNREFTLINLGNAEAVSFEDCLFEGNWGDVIFGETWGSEGCEDITVKGCTFQDNLIDINSMAIVFEDCTFDFDEAVDFEYAD